MNTICESGIVGMDGRLRMPMDRLNAEFAKHKGMRVVMRLEFAEQGSSAAQQAYYRNYIVPTIREALWKTGERKSEKQVDEWLVEQYPGDKTEMEFGVEITSARDFTKSQMSEYIDWLKQFAAENLETYIEDPSTI